MRYYDLDINGKVKGSYANPQPGKTLHLLEDAPDNESKRDGVTGSVWVSDTDIIDARLAEEARIAAKAQDINTNLPDWITVETAIKKAFPDPKQQAVILKIARVLYWIATDKKD